MNEIEIFGSFSGLLLNRNKTEGLWIGKLKIVNTKLLESIGQISRLNYQEYILVTTMKKVKN